MSLKTSGKIRCSDWIILLICIKRKDLILYLIIIPVATPFTRSSLSDIIIILLISFSLFSSCKVNQTMVNDGLTAHAFVTGHLYSAGSLSIQPIFHHHPLCPPRCPSLLCGLYHLEVIKRLWLSQYHWPSTGGVTRSSKWLSNKTVISSRAGREWYIRESVVLWSIKCVRKWWACAGRWGMTDIGRFGEGPV